MRGPTMDLLRNLLTSAPVQLLTTSEADATGTFRTGGWTRKQILGHLIDSCLNNHYRVVRAVLENGYSGTTYAQEGWVAIHRYDLLTWADLVCIWAVHNRLLLHLLEQIEEQFGSVECSGGEEQSDLTARIADYTSHLQHHLSQLLPSG